MDTNQEKHTPGPWLVKAGHLSMVYATDAEIAYDIENPADAALIAAAPELLEACRKKLTAQMLRETALSHELYTTRDDAMQAAEEAEFEADEFMRAAIAKAEGKP